MSDNKNIEEIIGYHFNDKTLLETAITHSSYAYDNGIASNERMEFLGDTVVGYAVSRYLYDNYPQLNEGEYSKIKASCVSDDSLCDRAIELHFDKFIKLGKSVINNSTISRDIYSDMFEAIVGAIALDGSFSSAIRFAIEILQPLIATHVSKRDFYDSKSSLIEYCQKNNLDLHINLKEKSGKQHNPTFYFEVYIDGKLISNGNGANTALAQQTACKNAINTLKIN